MIRTRWLAAGLLLLGLGWQQIMGETRVEGTIFGISEIILGLAGLALAFRERSWTDIAGLVTALLLTTAFFAAVSVDILARVQDVPLLSATIAFLSQIAGLSPIFHDGRLLAHVDVGLLDWRPTLSRLGGFPFLILWTGLLVCAVLLPLRRPWRWLGHMSLLVAIGLLLRSVLLFVTRDTLPAQGVETSAVWSLITILPVALLFAPVSRSVETAVSRSRGEMAIPVLLLGVAAFSGVLALRFEDPGRPKSGRVLFADTHGRWEPTDLPFDTQNFGRRNAYSFGNMYDLLGRYFHVDRLTEGHLDAALLSRYDVLILKTPTEPYLPQEIEEVERFVAGGGGLLLIGDHTDLFGMSTFMNRLSERFGIRFRADDTFSLADEGTSSWLQPAWLPHPIVGAIEQFDFETSCSLDIPAKARIVMAGHALGAEQADYNNPGFFGNIHLDLRDRLGFFPQVASLRHGQGRVVAFADSTPFSNFSLFFPGRWELAVTTVKFLNHRVSPWAVLPGTALAFAILLLMAALTLRHRAPSQLAALSLAVGLGLGTTTVMLASAGSGEMPSPHRTIPVVAFERSLSAALFPPSLNTDPSLDGRAFDTLFVTTQRLGYQPRMIHGLQKAMREAEMIVLLHPDQMLDTETQVQLLAYVSGGGALLVADSLINRSSTANAILQPFGLSLSIDRVDLVPETVVPQPDTPPRRMTRPVLSVQGGYPVLVDEAGRALYAEAQIGKGRVGVLAESLAVTRAGLGNRFYDTPDAVQQEKYNVAFTVLRRGMVGDE